MLRRIVLFCAVAACLQLDLCAYSVLTHEAIIDSVWKDSIEKALLKRFPHTTAAELKEAHAYAYGGSIVQDMGYYPLGSHLFTDLTHYVRSAGFVAAMLRDARDVHEYAFALGALAHYAADNTGHPAAINLAVPMLYPKLRARYGDHVTYGDDAASHVKTEFAFDVLQVARGRYASQAYHDFIGFEVSKPLLERAFKETYGLELKDVFTSLDAAIGSYRTTVSKTIPKATEVAWELKKDEIVETNPGITRESFLFNYRKPSRSAKVLAFFVRLVPKIGPFRAIAFHPPTPQTEKLFLESFDSTLKMYRRLISDEQAGRLRIPDQNFDLGETPKAGAYKLADVTYAKLVARLDQRDFEETPGELRADILRFYKDRSGSIETKRHREDWRKLTAALDRLSALTRGM